MIKILIIIIKTIIMIILIIKVKVIVITTIIITIIIKCRGRATNTEPLVTLYNGKGPLSNIKKSSLSDDVRVLYTPLKRLINHLKWWMGVDHTVWIPCLELYPTWFLKNNCNGNINQHNNNNSYNDNNNDSNNNINHNNNIMIIRLK